MKNKHFRRKIELIAVDFDGTLTSNPKELYPEIGKQKWVHKLVMKWIKYQQNKGVYIILNTLREEDALLNAVLWCWRQDFYPNNVNDNDPKQEAKWGYSRKIAADRYIDDRNVGIIGWILRIFG